MTGRKKLVTRPEENEKTLVATRHFAITRCYDIGVTGKHFVLRLYTQRWMRSLFVSLYKMDRPD